MIEGKNLVVVASPANEARTRTSCATVRCVNGEYGQRWNVSWGKVGSGRSAVWRK